MTYKNKPIPRVSGSNDPMPAYGNPETGEWVVPEGMDGAPFFHQKGTIIVDMWSGNSDTIRNLPKPCYVFSIINEGDSDITVQIHDFTFVVKVDRSYEGKFRPFTQVTITTNSEYSAEVKE